MIALIEKAVSEGARLASACACLGLSARAIQRWKAEDGAADRRAGPRTSPRNKLSSAERQRLLKVMNQPEYRDLSPSQIVPLLADQGLYIASESTLYRVLSEEKLAAHRSASRPPKSRPPREHVATGPNQVWSWDITYLRAPVAGQHFYPYLVMDVWSRKIVGAGVQREESARHGADLVRRACDAEGISGAGLVLHSDNGAPMKGSTMLATLERLGIATSYSRPGVSDDNPFVEALFRTAKYRPEYPDRAFASFEEASAWAERFVRWYNHVHRHSAIRYVTPVQRHAGDDVELLAQRERVYAAARLRRPDRWTTRTRNWSPPTVVRLNPNKSDAEAAASAA